MAFMTHASPISDEMGNVSKKGSVQSRFVAVSTVHDHIVRLVGTEPGSFDYAVILQVEGISYDLKSEEEQGLINDIYQAFLCGLSYPIQILWRSLPLNLSAYLEQFASHETASEADFWDPLRTAHRQFLEHLAARRTLLDRKIYLVIRVSSSMSETATMLHHLFVPARRRQQQVMLSLERARQELDLRVSEVMRVLTTMQVSARRLSGEQEIAPLYYSCLLPARATRYPLAPELIAGMNHPVQRSASSQVNRSPLHTATPPDQALALATSSTSGQRSDAVTPFPTFSQFADLIAPAAVVIAPDHLKVEEEYCQTIVVSHLPRSVAPGWLKPLMEMDEPMEVSIHHHPLQSALMVQRLRRQQMEYQSSRLIAYRKGNEVDPDLKVAESDVDGLLERLASGEERMLDLSLCVLIRGQSREELRERYERVQSVLHNMLLKTRTTLFEQEQGFRSCLPYGRNELGAGILLDSRSASTLFPFLSNALFHPEGVLEGITPQGDPVVLDAWSDDMANANRIILGPPGWGKSHQVKTSIVRMALKYASHSQKGHETGGDSAGDTRDSRSEMLPAFQVIVIDPEREYGRLTSALGGQVIRLAPGSTHHINPFDVPRRFAQHGETEAAEHGDRLADHVQKVHSLLEIMLADRTPDQVGTLSAQEKGLLDRALYESYRKVGITTDQQTHDRPAPLMRDLYEVLESGVCGLDPTGLLTRLQRYVHGSLAGLFAGPSNIALNAGVIVFDLHEMESELRPVGLFLVSNFVWTQSFQSTIPRQLIVDEAATLYQFASGAHFLEDLVRRARKHYLGVTIISQHPVIFRDSAIPANCATHVLMRQDATALDLISSMFKLSAREVQLIGRLGIGEALLTTSKKRLHVRFEASELEHLLATTDPREIARWQHDNRILQAEPLIQKLVAFDQRSADPSPQKAQEKKMIPEAGNVGRDILALPASEASAPPARATQRRRPTTAIMETHLLGDPPEKQKTFSAEEQPTGPGEVDA